jgi:lipid II:glycine glycyltransferase (peptidoglycan interpeptide bridge formation enzyme)
VTTGARERSEKELSLIPLSVAMFITYGDEVIYLFSGSDEKYMKEYNAQYLIQWHMIKYALKNGFKRYNFYGIQGLPDKTSKNYGIYQFKKGFTSPKTGRVVELLGAHELPINQPFYYLHQLLSKIKHH